METGIRERALDALSRARRRYLPLRVAALEVGLTPEEVLAHVGEAFEPAGDDWLAKDYDRIPRDMSILTPNGPTEARLRDSREATLNAQHANAVRHYIETGLVDRLESLPRAWVVTDSGRVELAVSEADLDRLAEGAELEYDVYLRLGG